VDPDPSVHFNVDLDPAPAPRQSLPPVYSIDPPGLNFGRPVLHGERPRSFRALFLSSEAF
jgi:hypothetical protein